MIESLNMSKVWNFVNVQRDDRVNYTLSETDRDILYNIGMNIEPLNGYARSIYEVLTGERIFLDIPDPRNSTRPRIALPNGVQSDLEFSTYPNPVQNGEYIILKTGILEDYSVSVFDIDGILIKEIKHTSKSNIVINTSSWHNGLYVMQINDEFGKNIYHTKVTIIQ